MTIEKAQADFDKLIAENGFTQTATTDLGHIIYHREWKKKVQVAWYGEQDDTLELRITLSYGYPAGGGQAQRSPRPEFHERLLKPEKSVQRHARDRKMRGLRMVRR